VLVVLSLLAAIGIGAGWVLQHRVIDPDLGADPDQGLAALMHKPLWWAGIAGMSIGQSLAGVALQWGPITLVAPVVASNLLWAFLLRSVLIRHRPPWRDIAGAVGFAAAVTVFVLVGGPKVSRHSQLADLLISSAVTIGVAVLAGGLVIAGMRGSVAVAAVTTAIAAGVLFGLQDVATRGAIILGGRHGWFSVVASLWPYLLIGAAVVAVLLTQRAFRSARLDYALAPMAATQPVLGVVLGVLLLGDELELTTTALAVEAACLAILVVSTALLARSPALRRTTSSPAAPPRRSAKAH
jgi:drug/metabolite transporter (DMT)-like permease